VVRPIPPQTGHAPLSERCCTGLDRSGGEEGKRKAKESTLISVGLEGRGIRMARGKGRDPNREY